MLLLKISEELETDLSSVMRASPLGGTGGGGLTFSTVVIGDCVVRHGTGNQDKGSVMARGCLLLP